MCIKKPKRIKKREKLQNGKVNSNLIFFISDHEFLIGLFTWDFYEIKFTLLCILFLLCSVFSRFNIIAFAVCCKCFKWCGLNIQTIPEYWFFCCLRNDEMETPFFVVFPIYLLLWKRAMKKFNFFFFSARFYSFKRCAVCINKIFYFRWTLWGLNVVIFILFPLSFYVFFIFFGF